MEKEYNPKISSRDEKELLEIIEFENNWEQEAVEQAKQELINRGYSKQDQDKYKNRKKSYKRRVLRTKSNASYSNWESVFYALFSPMRIVLGDIPYSDVLESKRDGYDKIWKQKLILTTVGIIFWISVSYISYLIAL